jgi:hypothetical protein
MFFQVIERVFDVPPHAPALRNKVVVQFAYRYVRDVGEGVFFCFSGCCLQGSFFAFDHREFEAAVADAVCPAGT